MRRPRSKGQYRIVSELILFGLGIMLTSYVITNFGTIRDTLSEVTIEDQMNGVMDTVSVAIIKLNNVENGTIRMSIPPELSGKQYRISIKDADGGKIVLNTLDGGVVLERQLFNIDYDNIVPGNRLINNSEIISTAEFIEIVKNEKITIRRVPLNATIN